MSSALSTDGRYVFVLNGGYNPPSISVVSLPSNKEVSRAALPDAWLGLSVTTEGDLVYVGGGSRSVIYELRFNPVKGELIRGREIALGRGPEESFIGDVTVSPDNRRLYAADLIGNTISVIDRNSGKVIKVWNTGPRPYRILNPGTGSRIFVTSWVDGYLYEYEATSGRELVRIWIGAHPTDVAWLKGGGKAQDDDDTPQRVRSSNYTGRLFVAAANSNRVYVVGSGPGDHLQLLETLNISLYPKQLVGMTPSALNTDREGKRLFVACSDANAVAVADISQNPSKVAGFIPTSWYPTGVRVLPDGSLLILNGKGSGSQPNPNGPNPARAAAPAHVGFPAPPHVEYIPRLQKGTAEFVSPPFEGKQLSVYTGTVLRNSPHSEPYVKEETILANMEAFSARPNGKSPLQHVIYIIKENRTYDQVLGDMPEGNGDPSLNLFGNKVTPNLHELAREFILYDNFYENADVSADGHNWITAAIAPDSVVKLWPNVYGGRNKTLNVTNGPGNQPPAGYIWSRALAAGVTVRDYGEWAKGQLPINPVSGSRQIQSMADPTLDPCVDMNYRSWDLEYSDIDRAAEFTREWKRFESQQQAPQLVLMWLPNDHTAGMTPGKLTPFSYSAQNDFAVGKIVDAISHSRFWSSSIIFVVEDDAQSGPDHVDSHRAPAWAISPYTRRGIVDSTMYNQMSVLRTIEMILGLAPLTQFDATAVPLFSNFSSKPDLTPYAAIQPQISILARNSADVEGAAESMRMNFSGPDLVDDAELNAVL